MAHTLERKLVEAEATARLNEYYYKAKSDRLVSWDQFARYLAALTASSGAIAGLLAKDNPHLWQFLTCLTAVLTLASSMLKWGDTGRRLSNLAARWADLAGSFSILDESRADEQERYRRYLDLRKQSELLQKEDALPREDKLAASIQQQVSKELNSRLYETAQLESRQQEQAHA
jgi:hypothetical protein